MVVITADMMMKKGLLCMNFNEEVQSLRSYDAKWDLFKTHYGVTPRVAALVLNDLSTTNIPEAVWNELCPYDDIPAKLEDTERGEKGWCMFLMSLHFLWTNPKNRFVLASRFGVCEKYARGKSLWKWVYRIAALQAKVIVWPEESFNNPNWHSFIITVDCRDHKCWEKKHPSFNLDQSYASKKHGKHASFKYELAIDIHRDKIVWMNGPFKATKHDLTIFKEDGLCDKIRALGTTKYVVCDLGYRSKPSDNMPFLAIPSSTDPICLKKFKSLARCRQEDVNGRMATFKILWDEFTHTEAQFKGCYEAIAVLIQYSLDAGDSRLHTAKVV